MSSSQVHTQQWLLVQGCRTQWCKGQGLLHLLVEDRLLPQGEVVQAQLVEPKGRARAKLIVCIAA
jgi:hypothetical protein